MLERGEHGEAIEVVDDLVARWPRLAEARLVRATLLAHLGRFEEARVELDTTSDLCPLQERLQGFTGALLIATPGWSSAVRWVMAELAAGANQTTAG